MDIGPETPSSANSIRRAASPFSGGENGRGKSSLPSGLIPFRARKGTRRYSIFLLIPVMLTFFVWLTNCSEGAKTKAADSRAETRSQSTSSEPALGASVPGQAQHAGHQHEAGEATKTTTASSPEQTTSTTREKAAAKQEKTLYHCPMHPNYISDRPGECPICGMTLVPIEKEEEKESLTLPGGAVEISPERQQLLGVTFGQAERRELHQIISAYGRLSYDETRLASVTTKFSGWVEKLYVDYTGKLVRRGEPLFSIYSPDLIAAQEEYLLALRAQKTFEPREGGLASRSQGDGRAILGSALNSKRGSADLNPNLASLVEAAKRRLLLWDIDEAQIARMEKEGKPFRSLTIYSPVTGFITEKNVVEGKFVMAGENLFSLADLSRVWLLADIYELDLPLVAVGKEVEVEIASFPGETFRGRITYIFPYLENESRTVKVRVEFPNPGYRLKPEMYGRVKMHLMLGSRLSIPEEAIIDTGERKLVFVVHEGNHFEPREIKLGIKAGEFYEILSGLEEGERVVTSAQFLIDSESRLKAAVKGFHQHPSEKKPEAKEEKAPTPPAKHIH